MAPAGRSRYRRPLFFPVGERSKSYTVPRHPPHQRTNAVTSLPTLQELYINPDHRLAPITRLPSPPPQFAGQALDNAEIETWLEQIRREQDAMGDPEGGVRRPAPAPAVRHWTRLARKYIILLVFLMGFVVLATVVLSTFIGLLSSSAKYHPGHRHQMMVPTNATLIPHAAFQPVEDVAYRLPDVIDTFDGYKYRSDCDISSMDLHAPFSPLCPDRSAMLSAMSSGGRIGFDAPYMPRGCDMRWFTTEEACEILGRFGKVIFVGDSMMRHVVGSINVLLRKDLGYGAVTDWNFSPKERRECFCNSQFNVKACSVQGIFKTADVVKNAPDSVACPAGTFDVTIEQMIRFPIPAEEIDRLKSLLGTAKPAKPYAFVFGHGLWNDLDLQATVDWLDQILAATTDQLPYLGARGAFWPRLFVTPNAAGVFKPDEWLVTQGNKALMTFEESVRVVAGRRGIEHLGTWNMSIQATKYDGVHVDLRGNLLKAMMVLNWLNLLEVERH